MSPTPRPHPTDGPPTRTRPGRLRRARRFWAVISLLSLVGGLALTRTAFDAERRNHEEQVEKSIEVATRDATAALRLELQRQNDFVTDTAGLVATDPDVSTAELDAWVRATRALERYPELGAVGFVRYVDVDDLDDHAARLAADPVLAPYLSPDGSIVVEPEPDRSAVCLLQAIAYREADPGPDRLSPTFDVCADRRVASSVGPVIATGQSTYRSGPAMDGRYPLLVITPVFEGPDLPPTVAARRETFLGTIVTIVDADALLDRVVALRSDTALDLRYLDSDAEVSFSHGDPAPGREHERVVPLVPGWQLVVRPAVDPTSSWTTHRILLLAAGTATPVLLAALVFVLGTSRARAFDLVDEATEELRHLSLHDPLTGLANRRLLSQRADAMLARARRDGSVPSALFIDLDGFKGVNDTHGHAAGDVVLQALGVRLREVVRTSDTVGRFGGDEFVVLLDGTGPGDRAEVVAVRLLEAVREPIVVDAEGTVVSISASIGLASGARDDGDVLIHDADVAAYRAKADGKDRWMAATGEPDVPSLS